MYSKWLILLVVSLAGAVEVYDEIMNERRPSEFGQYDGLESGPLDAEQLGSAEELAAAEVMLYKLLAAPHSGKILTFPYRSRWINSEVENNSRLMLPKRMLATSYDMLTEKRSSSQKQRSGTTNVAARAQPKWKTKKGRGSPVMCYFKLCAFRPMY